MSHAVPPVAQLAQAPTPRLAAKAEYPGQIVNVCLGAWRQEFAADDALALMSERAG